MQTEVSKYAVNLVTWLSLGINTILGGSPYQTFSARNYQWFRAGKWHLVYYIDHIFGDGHCEKCWHSWVKRL